MTTTTTTTTTNITVKVLFFASARDCVDGITETTIDIPNDNDDSETTATTAIATTNGLRQILAKRYPKLIDIGVLDEQSLTLALNEEYVLAGQNIQLKNNDVIALIPPISGG